MTFHTEIFIKSMTQSKSTQRVVEVWINKNVVCLLNS